MGGQSGLLSKGSEYICISCWASFHAEASASGEVTCPHCGYVQPAAEEYPGANAAKAEASQPPPSSPDLDSTMADTKMPWTDESGGRTGPLEPISFDDLEELEALLGGDDTPKPRPKPRSAPPVPSKPTAGAKVQKKPAPAKAAKPTAPAEHAPPPAPEPASDAASDASAGAAPTVGATTVWRLKSDSGLTYSFFDVNALLRWHDGLGSQKHSLLSTDGMQWKPVSAFRKRIDAGEDVLAAYESTESSRPPAVNAPPSATATTQTNVRPEPKPGSGTAARTRPRADTAVKTRPTRPGDTGQRPRPGREPSVPPRGGRGVSVVSRVADLPGANPWPGRLGFMALGLVVGGAGVYFGMYLLGFYDLVFHF